LNKNKIKFYTRLQLKKNRDTEQLYLAEGIKIVNEAISYNPGSIRDIICTEEAAKSIYEFSKEKITIADYKSIKKISTLKTPQNVIAVIETRQNRPPRQITDIAIALESVRDPGNMGTIIRLADWFGVKDIICSPDCVDCYNPKVVQSTMGAILRVNISYIPLKKYFQSIKDTDIDIYGTSLNGEDLYKTKLKVPTIIIMGNESKGISRELDKYISGKILIPNFSRNKEKTESLNVSTATAIVLAEFRRSLSYSK